MSELKQNKSQLRTIIDGRAGDHLQVNLLPKLVFSNGSIFRVTALQFTRHLSAQRTNYNKELLWGWGCD